jgi:hypothetical protein
MKKKSALVVLSLAQERAIGRMTVKFNWMEHSLEVMINLILCTDEVGLVTGCISNNCDLITASKRSLLVGQLYRSRSGRFAA